MVGQSLGAKKPERAEQAVWLAGKYNLFFLGVVGLIFVAFAPFIVDQFTDDAAVMKYGIDGLRVVAAGFVMYAYGMVMANAFNGAGDTWTPTLLNLFCFWAWEIPLAYVFSAKMGMGAHGVFLSIPIAFSTFALLAMLMFKRGAWKRKAV
jgi:Na+-driven multidrug efflux pump